LILMVPPHGTNPLVICVLICPSMRLSTYKHDKMCPFMS
jgi:hypothetical protein